MIRYAYVLNNFRRWACGFSKLLMTPITGGILKISPEQGTGWLRAGHLHAGISYLVIDLSLRDDLTLIRQNSYPPGLSLVFNFETDHPLRLSSTANEQETIHPRDSRLKKIAIFFPHEFLHRYLDKNILLDLLRYTETPPRVHNQHLSFEYRHLLDEIIQIDPQSPMHHLQLHNRILQLVEKFLYSLVIKTPQLYPHNISWAKGKEKDIEALKSVKKVLSDSQLNKFPSVETLSRTAMMSSTKLKTRFKQIYGMKLYEFYNRTRLQQAKEMLRSGSYSVRQVGVNIGFSNLSNFAKAFKKEFGVLPKEILKNR